MIYPKPQIPTLPVLSLGSFHRAHDQHIPSVLDAARTRFVTSGRVAIALALLQMNIGKGDKVLLPAYHCSSMVEPIIWAGAEPVFYKIHADTSVDMEDIKNRLDGSTKLLLVTNYFGFPQKLSQIRSFCDAHHILLLEDCAHSFFGECDGKPLGTFGDYAVASAMKFFPIYDGGYLVSTRHRIAGLSLESAGPGFEIKAALNTLEKSFAYGRLGFLKKMTSVPIWFKNFIWETIKRRTLPEKVSFGPDASEGGFGFEAKWLEKKATFFSKYLIKQVCKTRIAVNRRRNYIALQTALEGLPGCHPLFPELPAGVYPYVFPLVTDEPEIHFSFLKKAGVPVIRFGEFLWQSGEASVCQVSADLSRRVLQFPCHQELKEAELEWMIKTISATFLSNGSVQK